MAKLLRKALGLFVEFNDDNIASTANQNPSDENEPAKFHFQGEDLEKFETHFEQVMDAANLPGPDYYEFIKMMEVLEKAVPDEKARMAAVFASLSVQGLTKDKLLKTAEKYQEVIENDHQNFNNALSAKSDSDINNKKQTALELDQTIRDNSELIQKLTKEITKSQVEIGKLKEQISESEDKLANSKKGYEVAYNAMLSKIKSDIRSIQTSI
jgi:hypothetical protein